MAIKRAIFKPSAFFKGFLLPLAQDASSKEAAIVGSILMKVSLPTLHASATMIKLCHMDYSIGTGFFLKVLIRKRFSLPTLALEELIKFFGKFVDEE